METKKPMDIDTVLSKIKKFSENIGKTISQQGCDIKKAQLFGLLFKSLPTYSNLDFRNKKTPLFTGVHPVFSLLASDNFPLVNPKGTKVETLFSNTEGIYRRLIYYGDDTFKHKKR